MAYLAIARKWRPQRFEDIVGQGHVTRTLQNAIQLGRVHHAFLFTGARGVGKTTAARILAKALNCETGPTPTPCNECRSCKEITSGIANDVQEIDAASNTGVDNVRDLRDKLRYLPSSGKHKIYIIDEVHMLSVAAFNALLKTLEEPPPHVVFIFATTDPQKVPDTILSRCQRFDFKRIPLKQIVEKLGEIASSEGVQISEASLLMISREAEGSMRDAQSLLDQVLASAGTVLSDEEVVEILGIIDRRLIFDCIGGVLEREPDRALEVVDRIYGYGFDIKQFAKELLEVVRHLNVVKVSNKAERFIDVSTEEFGLLKQMASKVTLEELSRHFNLLLSGFDELARSESPRFVLEMTVLRMAQVRPVQALDELLGRLAAMESALRGGSGGAGGGAGGGGRPGGGVPPFTPRGGDAGGGGPRFGPAGNDGGAPRFGAATPSTAAPEGGGPRFGAAAPGASAPEGGAPRFGPGAQAAPNGGGAASSAVAGFAAKFNPPGAARGGNPYSSEARTPNERPGLTRPSGSPPGEHARTGGFSAPSGGEEGEDDDSGPPVAPAGPSVSAVPPAPKLSPAPAPGVVTGRWLEFMDFMLPQGDNRSKYVFLKDASPVREEPERILLGLRTSLSVSRAEREIADPDLLRLLEEHFGTRVSLQLTVLTDDTPAGMSFLTRELVKERSRIEEIERSELTHPRVKLAASVFEVDPRDMRVEIEKARQGE